MINSALILVPHQDDDLNIAGSILDQMTDAKVKISVCFVTNGDYDGKETVRAKEVHEVSKIFGYSKVYYLGYGDGGIDQESLYYADEDEIRCSHSGYTETHCVLDYEDFHYKKYGTHASYSKINLKNDIKDLLLEVRADLIFCVDKDSHPDHKLVSDLFDEAIQEIIKITDYRPLVLKKFAYLGVWHGIDDYFVRPVRPTECIAIRGNEKKTDSTPHNWSDRVRFAVTPAVCTARFWNSPLFKAYRAYKSQGGAAAFSRTCNADTVYWFFDTCQNEYMPAESFPIEKTPFRFFNPVNGNEKECFAWIYAILYRSYVLLFYKIPDKLKRIYRSIKNER